MRLRLCVLLFTIFLFSQIITGPYFAETHQTTRAWPAGISIKSIELIHSSDEPTDFFEEYINKYHEVKITIENTGHVVLTNVNITYQVKRGSIIDIEGADKSKSKLMIGEVYESVFDWTPVMGDGTVYTINVTLTAENFGNILPIVYAKRQFTIRDVKNDIGPIAYRLAEPASEFSGEYSNITHTLIAQVNNFGNFRVTNAFLTAGTIFSGTTGQQLWTDSTTFANSINAKGFAEVIFSKPWQPPNTGFYILNLSTTLTGDSRPFNDNITCQIYIRDILDAGIKSIQDLETGGIYPCIPIAISAKIANTGNVNITTSFSASLKISSYPSGTVVFLPMSVPIPVTGAENISTPGSFYNVTFPILDYAQGLKPGLVWVNISIDSQTIEQNGSGFNNNFSIVIELKNWTNIQLDVVTPKTGAYRHQDITEVVVNVSNKGTVDFEAYIINLTVNNLDSNETWNTYSDQSNTAGLLVDNYKLHTFIGWNFKYNAKFELNVTVALSSAPMVVRASRTVVIELLGGEVNGTIKGRVFGSIEQDWLANITIRAYLPLQPVYKLENSTVTASDGSFSIGVSALPEGRVYSMVVSHEDNYWWEDKTYNVKIFSERITELSIVLDRKPTGRIQGSVELIAPEGAPAVADDWTGISLTVENTHIIFSTNDLGNFDAELVAGLINITVSKNNFESNTVKNIQILANSITTKKFTLVESWGVKLTPAHEAFDIDPKTNIIADFDTILDVNSLTTQTFGLLDVDGNVIPGFTKNDFYLLKGNKTCLLIPPVPLEYNTTYQIALTPALLTESGTPAIHRKWQSTFTTTVGRGSAAGFCNLYWSRMPLEGVNISLKDHPEFVTETDENGFYILENIQPGEFQLNIKMAGYTQRFEDVTIIPDRIQWKNITFSDELPVPKLWGNTLFNRKILITNDTTDRISVNTNFTLTSNIPLDPEMVDHDTLIITEKMTGEVIKYKSVTGSENRLNFIFDPEVDLEYNTSYEVIYNKGLQTFDGRVIFQNKWNYCNFTTQFQILQSLEPIIFKPKDKEVNVPINSVVSISFLTSMNKTSVEDLISASFNITAFSWYDKNSTVHLEHQSFDYFKVYSITLNPGMISSNGLYHLTERINISFTTLSGLIEHVFGPIVDPDGKAVVGASVIIYDSNGLFLKSSMTNSTGHAKFYFESPLGPGNYSLTIMKKGYNVTTWRFSINSTGGIEFDSPLPRLEKKGEANGWSILLIAGIVLIIILIIIFIISIYFIMFQKKPETSEPTDETATKPHIKTSEPPQEKPSSEQLLTKVRTDSGDKTKEKKN